MTNTKEKVLKDFAARFGRSRQSEVILLDSQKEPIEKWLSSALDRYVREVIKEIVPDTFQNTPISNRPHIYQNEAWLGWNACRGEIQKRADELLGKE